MSYTFVATFSPTALGLEEALDHLEESFADTDLEFANEVARLVSRSGRPMAHSLATTEVASVPEVYDVAEKWWGASMLCTSTSLLEELGRNTSIEIDIAIHRAPDEHHQVTYTEQKGAFFARVQNPELELKLAATLAKMCTELGAICAIYEEEADDENPPVVTVDRIRALLAEADEPTARAPWLAVVARSALGLDDAQRLAGTLADRVKISTDDYVLLPFFCVQTPGDARD